MENRQQKHIGLMMKPFLAQAAFEGRKKMTRRTKGLENINPAATEILKVEGFEKQGNWAARFKLPGEERYQITEVIKCPYGEPGDLIWVKETWTKVETFSTLIYKANFPELTGVWKSSMLMPKEAARTWGVITSIRVERLHDISEEDAVKEGIKNVGCDLDIGGVLYTGNWYDNYGSVGYSFLSAQDSFQTLWQSINGKSSWDANPWVWVIEWKQCEAPQLEGGAQ